MKTILFEIVKQKVIAIELPIEAIRKFPVHSHNLYEAEKIILIYEYDPATKLDQQKYIEFLKAYLKQKYNAYSITVGELQKQLQ